MLEGRRQYVEIAGNMAPVAPAKSAANELVSVNFRPFRENRLPLLVRIKDLKAEPAGQVLFIPEPLRGPAADQQKPPAPICVLNVVLPGVSSSLSVDSETPEFESKDIVPLSEAFPLSEGYFLSAFTTPSASLSYLYSYMVNTRKLGTMY